MKFQAEELVQEALELGFDKAGLLDVADLAFLPQVREMCSADRCHQYGKSWSCPPGCGSIEECEARARKYSRGILVETIGQLEDSFDIEGMEAASQKHKEVFDRMASVLKERFGDVLCMGAGSCTRCTSCTYPDAPCRFPDRVYPSMEACGLLVSDVCKACGLPYINGVNTVTYIGCYLIEKAPGALG